MNNRRLFVGVAAVITVVAVVLLVMRPWRRTSGTQGGNPAANGVAIVTAIAQAPTSLDPARLADTETSPLVTALFAPLTLVKPGGELVYVLAESIEMSNDARQATIRIRKEARFSDGTPVTAADVQFSFERLWRMKHPQRMVVERIASMKTIGDQPGAHASGFEVVDERTLVVRFEKPEPEFARLTATAFCGIVKSGGDDKPKAPLDSHLIGAGPFVLDDVEPGFKYRFKANPAGFPLQHGLRSLEVKVIDNEQEAVREAGTGAINLIRLRGNQLREATVSEGATLRPRPEFRGRRLERFPSQDLVYLRANWKADGLRDVAPERRREWLASVGAMIDKRKLAEGIYASTAAPAATPLARNSSGDSATTAGAGGALAPGTKIELITASVGELRQVSDAVAADLRAGGSSLQVDVRMLPIPDLVGRLFGENYQVALLWLEGNLSPAELSWASFFDAGNGISALAEPLPEVAARLDAARSIADASERRKALIGLLDYVNQTQTAMVPLVRREAIYLVGEEIAIPGADANGICHFSLVEARR